MDSGRTTTELDFLLISLFLYTAKSDVDGEEENFGFRDILRISIPIISETKKDKNLDFVLLESPCDPEQDRPIPGFKIPFPDYVPKTTSVKKGGFQILGFRHFDIITLF